MTGVLVFRFAGVPVQAGFDPAIASRLMAFGIPLAASLGVEAVLLNTDYIVIGHDETAALLGFYLLAFNVSTWALSVITAAVRYVSVAGFSRLSEVDRGPCRPAWRRSVPLLVTVLLPIAVLTACLGSPLIEVLYGARWLPAAPRAAVPDDPHRGPGAGLLRDGHPHGRRLEPVHADREPVLGGGVGTGAHRRHQHGASSAPASPTRAWRSWSPCR